MPIRSDEEFVVEVKGEKALYEVMGRASDLPAGTLLANLSWVERITGKNRVSMYRAIKTGKLKAYKDGDFTMVTEPDLAKYLGRAVALTAFNVLSMRAHLKVAVPVATRDYVYPWLRRHGGNVLAKNAPGVPEKDVQTLIDAAVESAVTAWHDRPSREYEDVEYFVKKAFAEIFENPENN